MADYVVKVRHKQTGTEHELHVNGGVSSQEEAEKHVRDRHSLYEIIPKAPNPPSEAPHP